MPFASPNALFNLSRLAVWWLRLGIAIERIKPGHPQQNGRHERMHLTLKKETTRPPGMNALLQQARFDAFVGAFNAERPHQALDMQRPADRYTPSQLVSFMHYDLGYIDLEQKTLQPIDNPFGTRLSPRCSSQLRLYVQIPQARAHTVPVAVTIVTRTAISCRETPLCMTTYSHLKLEFAVVEREGLQFEGDRQIDDLGGLQGTFGRPAPEAAAE